MPNAAARRDNNDILAGVPHMHEALQGRRTISGYTIDDPQAQNLEDGFKIAFRKDGRAVVQVSLSDSAVMVPKGGALDRMAAEMPMDRRFKGMPFQTMLPRRWVLDNLSFAEGALRPAVTFTIGVDAVGGIESVQVERTGFVNSQQISENMIQNCLRQKGGNPVKDWLALAQLLRTRREDELIKYMKAARTPNAAEQDVLQKLGPRAPHEPRDAGSFIIHELMSLTNRAAAVFLAEKNMPYLRTAYAVGMNECYAQMGNNAPQIAEQKKRFESAAQRIAEDISYARVSSPSRRYDDMVNLRAVVAAAEGKSAPYDAADLQSTGRHVRRMTGIFNALARDDGKRVQNALVMIANGAFDRVERMLGLGRDTGGDYNRRPSGQCPGGDIYRGLRDQVTLMGWRSPQFSVRKVMFEGCAVYNADMYVTTDVRRQFATSAASNDPKDAVERASALMMANLSRSHSKFFTAPQI